MKANHYIGVSNKYQRSTFTTDCDGAVTLCDSSVTLRPEIIFLTASWQPYGGWLVKRIARLPTPWVSQSLEKHVPTRRDQTVNTSILSHDVICCRGPCLPVPTRQHQMADPRYIPTQEELTKASDLKVLDSQGQEVPFGSVYATQRTIVVFIRKQLTPLIYSWALLNENRSLLLWSKPWFYNVDPNSV